MKSDPSEYKEIIKKLLEKTRQQRVQWEYPPSQFGEVRYLDTFRCNLGPQSADSFSFEITSTSERDDSLRRFLVMTDQGGNEIFRVATNDLPTSPEEEEVSQMIEEIYDLARRQALKVEQKLVLASTLLDRV